MSWRARARRVEVGARDLAGRAGRTIRPEPVRRARAALTAAGSAAELLDVANTHIPGGAVQVREEIVPFLDYAAAQLPRVVVEIGTQFGGTNFLLAHALPSAEVVVGIDLIIRNRSWLRALRRPEQRLVLLSGSSQSERMVSRLTRAVGGRPVDLLLVDGDHAYAGVLRDFLLYRGLVAPGGIVAFHDIVPDNRLRYGVATDAYAGEVPVLWQRLKPHYRHHEFVRSWEQEGFGIGALVMDREVVLDEAALVAAPIPG